MPFKATEKELVFPRLFVLGSPGSGKTHFIGLVHEMTTRYSNTGGVYDGDFDNGWSTLKGQNFDVTVEEYHDADPKKPLAWKRFCDDEEKIYTSGNPNNYAFIAGDSFTTMQNGIFNDIVSLMTGRIIKNRIFYRNVAMTDKSDYGVFERFVSNDFFPSMIAHCDKYGFILTVHTEFVHGGAGEPPRIVPKIKGEALGTETIMLYFNEAILTKISGTGSNAKNVIQTKGDSYVSLKSQIPGMPPEVTFEEYILRMGVHYGFLKGENIKKYATDKKIEIGKLANFKMPA
jgi:hypothetical protein